MAILTITGNEKCTPKQWAADMIDGDLELITEFYHERWAMSYLTMTESEKQKVDAQVQIFAKRIKLMLRKSMGTI